MTSEKIFATMQALIAEQFALDAEEITMDRKIMRKRSQELRKNPTLEEKILWYEYLRTYPIQWNRQKVFGDYIVDFYCKKLNLVIELDADTARAALNRRDGCLI